MPCSDLAIRAVERPDKPLMDIYIRNRRSENIIALSNTTILDWHGSIPVCFETCCTNLIQWIWFYGPSLFDSRFRAFSLQSERIHCWTIERNTVGRACHNAEEGVETECDPLGLSLSADCRRHIFVHGLVEHVISEDYRSYSLCSWIKINIDFVKINRMWITFICQLLDTYSFSTLKT
jgi:hypothetical protein